MGCAAAAMLAVPAFANATVYCVGGPSTGCDVVESNDSTGLQTALTAAQAGTGGDTVKVGSGTYSTTSPAGFHYSNSGSGVTVIGGVGGGTTTISVPDPGSVPASYTEYYGLRIYGPGSSISNLTVHLPNPADPPNTNQAFFGISAEGANSTVDSVTVSGPSGIAYNGTGALMTSGTLSNSTIAMPLVTPGIASRGVWVLQSNPGALNLAGDIITGSYAVENDNQSATGAVDINRSTLHASQRGILAEASTVHVADSIIDLGAFQDATGLIVGYSNQFTAVPSHATASGTTIYGSGNFSTGAKVFAYDANTPINPMDPPLPPDSSTLTLTGSIIRLTGSSAVALERDVDNGGTVDIATGYSNYDPATIDDNVGVNGGAGAITQSHQTNLDPMFVTPGTDFHLQSSSPLIDAGDPTAPPPSETDIDGDPRAVMAIASCAPRQDIGADEFVPASAVVPLDCTPPPSGGSTQPQPTTPVAKKCKKRKRHSAAAAKKRCKKRKPR
jgi:hypothetical protein